MLTVVYVILSHVLWLWSLRMLARAVNICLKCIHVIDRTEISDNSSYWSHTHTHIHLTALCLGLPGWAGTRKAKPIWILLKQETVSVSGISWAICKSAPRSRQITTPAHHHSVFYRPDALPAAQPTVSKHWRHKPVTALHLKSRSKLETVNR